MTAYQNITGSGYLNNPVRTVLIDRDNRPGSYPTHTSPTSQLLPESLELSRPFRDDLSLDVSVVYARSKLFFSGLPFPDDLVKLVNAQGELHTFIFKKLPGPPPASNTYIVDMESAITAERSPLYPGLTPSQLTVKNITEKFIDAVNSISASFISARPGRILGEVILEQKIPGTVGNQVNVNTSPAISLEDFTGGRDSGVRYPYGVFVGDGTSAQSSRELINRVVRSSRSGTLDVPTSGRSSLLNAPSDGHPYAAIAPYDESNAHQAFGLDTRGSQTYGTQGNLEGLFFTRGAVSGSLDEPLRVKDRIVIDLTPSAETTLLHSGGYPNHPMAYFNFDSRRWEPIGLGRGVTGPSPTPSTLQDLLDTQYLGFSQGLGNYFDASSDSNVEVIDSQLRNAFSGEKSVFRETGWFSPIDTFGFPLHPKYHATGSQQLDCELIVDRPFLLEKIIYQFSASMPSLQSELLDFLGVGEYRGSGGVFFILNQRKANPDLDQESSYTNVYVARSSSPSREWSTPQDGGTNGPTGDHWILPYDNGGIPRTLQLSPSDPNVYVDTVRDLVTFARIGTVWPTYDQEIENLIEPGFPHPADFMDLAIEVPASGTFSGEYTLAAPMRAPTQNSAVSVVFIPAVSPNNITRIYASKDTSTRNSIDIATGRAHNGEFFGPEISYRVNGESVSKQLFSPRVDAVNSPYLIKPGDRLVFGWQSPTYYALGDNSTQKTLKILPGAGKLILYGSYLQDDKPVHDIYRDQLNSDALHESLPTGPWVLDRFESDPQMCYFGSMREEHVTGTMVTRNADGSLSVTPESDLGIRGVRAVSARASDGSLGQRWSFFRNSRLFDAEEQYYDSMQPNPLDVLFSDPNVRAWALGIPSVGYIPLMLPGETFFTTSFQPNLEAALNTHSNRSFFLRYPFQEGYEEFARVKKINSNVLSGREVPAFISTGVSPDTITLTSTRINSAIVFVTGSTGTPGPTTLSGFLRPGGLTKTGTSPPNTGGYIFPYVSDLDLETNPVRSDSYPADPIVDDPVSGVNYWLSRFMGCFGDGFLGMCQFGIFLIGPAGGSAAALIYRGTKYGLVNPSPLFSSAVFSGTQFGQPRDMLEQRQYTRFSLNDSSLTDAAVEVVFIDRSKVPLIDGSRTNNITSGSATNSSNISHFATSERPYDDSLADLGLIWDRQTPLPETLISL